MAEYSSCRPVSFLSSVCRTEPGAPCKRAKQGRHGRGRHDSSEGGRRAGNARTTRRRIGMRGDKNSSPTTPLPMRAEDRWARDPARPLGRSAAQTGCATTTRATRGRRAGDSDHDDVSDGRWSRLGRLRKRTRKTAARPALGPTTWSVAALDRRGKLRRSKVCRSALTRCKTSRVYWPEGPRNIILIEPRHFRIQSTFAHPRRHDFF